MANKPNSKTFYAGMAIGPTLETDTEDQVKLYYEENPTLLVAHNMLHLTVALHRQSDALEGILAEIRQAKKDGRPLIQPTPKLFIPNR